MDGIPILVKDPRAYLARFHARTPAEADITRTGAPDPITPHLPANMLGAPGGFGQWLGTLGDGGPDAYASAYAGKFAPAGPVCDVGCGLGVMARRMAAMGRDTWGFDYNLDALLLAKGVLCGELPGVSIPTHRNGARQVKVPFRPIPSGLNLAVADATLPPFATGAFAWVHLGDVLDDAGDAVGDVLVASAELVGRAGLLTVCTAYGAVSSEEGPRADPQEELLEAIDGLGFDIVEQADRIPQVTRTYDRSYLVRFSHCIAARRR